MLFRIYFILVSCLLFVVNTLNGQSSGSEDKDLIYIQALFKSGKLQLAEQSAEILLGQQAETGSVGEFYKALCITYKVKRAIEEQRGIPAVYNYLNGERKGLKKEKLLLLSYFQIRALREYYLDCLNLEDPWILNKKPEFKANVLELILKLSKRVSKSKYYGRYPLSDYPEVFSSREETFRLNEYLIDKVVDEIIVFCQMALLLERKSDEELEVNISDGGGIYFELQASDTVFQVALVDLLQDCYSTRLRGLSSTKRDSLVPIILLKGVLELNSVFTIPSLDSVVRHVINLSNGVITDYLLLEYGFWRFDNDQEAIVRFGKELLKDCDRMISSYPKTYFLHINSRVLKSKLSSTALSVKGLSKVYPFQVHEMTIESQHLDSLYYILCSNPLNEAGSIKGLYQRRNFDALKTYAKQYKIAEGSLIVHDSSLGVRNFNTLKILGLAEGSYCLFVGSKQGVFEGELSLLEYEVSRKSNIVYEPYLGDTLRYDFSLQDFSSSFIELDIQNQFNKVDYLPYFFFDQKELYLDKSDTLIVNGSFLRLGSDGRLDLPDNKPIVLNKVFQGKGLDSLGVGNTDANGSITLSVFNIPGQRSYFEFLPASSEAYVNSDIFGKWIEKYTEPYEIRKDSIGSQRRFHLNKGFFGSSDTLRLNSKRAFQGPGCVMLSLDGQMVQLLTIDELKTWKLPLATNFRSGKHVLECFYLDRGKPQYQQLFFTVSNSNPPAAIELKREEGAEEGVYLSGKYNAFNEGDVLLVFGSVLSEQERSEIRLSRSEKEIRDSPLQKMIKQFFSSSFEKSSQNIDASKYLRQSFPLVKRFREYGCMTFDYRISANATFISPKVGGRIESNAMEASETNFWGYPKLSVFPINMYQAQRATIARVIPVDSNSSFSIDLPEMSEGEWYFKLFLMDSEGSLNRLEYELKQ